MWSHFHFPHSLSSLRCTALSLPSFLPSLRLRCPDTSSRCAISSYNVLCFFSVRGGRESYNLYAVIRGLRNIMSNANLRPRNENWYEIKCNDFNKVRWDRCRHFLYIFIATLSLRASHSLHPRNRLVMCCRQSRCVKRRNIVIQDRVKGDDRLL